MKEKTALQHGLLRMIVTKSLQTGMLQPCPLTNGTLHFNNSRYGFPVPTAKCYFIYSHDAKKQKKNK